MSRKLFCYQKDLLHFGASPFSLLPWTKKYRGPLIVYDLALIEERIQWIQTWSRLGRLHYAMKANFHPEILKTFRKMNCGLDVVSVGEMRHAMKFGFKPKDFIFSGVAKSPEELKWAIRNKIYQINIESLSELKKIIAISKSLGLKNVSVGLRLNPEIDAETHPSISTALKDSKFGIDFSTAAQALELIEKNPEVSLKALSFHLGSQIMNVQVFKKALDVMKPFFTNAQKRFTSLDRLDLGGGLGIDYKDADLNKDMQRWQNLQELLSQELKGIDAFILLEVGRFLVARSGVMISRVEVIKQTESKKNFLIIDAGMSHLMRPALYDSYHEILPLYKLTESSEGRSVVYEVVGPICESTDVVAKNRRMPSLEEGDFVAICDVGAYGAAMASRYNLRPSAKELVVNSSVARKKD